MFPAKSINNQAREYAQMPKVELRLVSRKYFGFENALRRQVADFESRHPELSVSLDFLEVHDLYEQMVVKEGCRKGSTT